MNLVDTDVFEVYTSSVLFGDLGVAMKSISMKEARQRFAKLVGDAERGRSVTITRRGRVVAKLIPAGSGSGGAFPDLGAFRSQIEAPRKALSETVIERRRNSRY